MSATNEDCSPATCSLKLSARGTPNQLIVYLRNAADQIERDQENHPLPWFNITSGAMMGDFKVSPANAHVLLPEGTQEGDDL